MIGLLLILTIPLELIYQPRFDYTRDNKLLLWYTYKKNRVYTVIL